MSMLDSFFNKGFKGAKCKTLLKLTIPRIKLLRNRREVQIKQMRREIAKLLQTGQEATARIRVEHIIREENMMAAQEIIELYCELIAVRLPIIETQRECPLDLKEAISSVCFAAPRCEDLPELQQVQMLFAAKYGREFIAAATELMPDCGVNRQLIELLSVRAPSAEIKLKLLKEIAEEHELDWDAAASETEFFTPHEDLLNGPSQFMNQSKLPPPKEKHDETVYSASAEASHEKSDSDSDSELDSLDLPEVPTVSLRPVPGGITPETIPPQMPRTFKIDREPAKHSLQKEDVSNESGIETDVSIPEQFVAPSHVSPDTSDSESKGKQFSPYISFPASFSTRQGEQCVPHSKSKSDLDIDLQDVLAAAHAAAESAERAAAAARSAASLAEIRISELIKKRHESISDRSDHTIHTPGPHEPHTASTQRYDHQNSPSVGTPQFDHQNSCDDTDCTSYPVDTQPSHALNLGSNTPSPISYDDPKMEFDPPSPDMQVSENQSLQHQPQRQTSMEDNPYFSYPNLFRAPDPNLGSGLSSVDKL